MSTKPYDVLVVGTGAAGLTAALTAAEHGASVLMLSPVSMAVVRKVISAMRAVITPWASIGKCVPPISIIIPSSP